MAEDTDPFEGRRIVLRELANNSRLKIEDHNGGKLITNITLVTPGVWKDSKIKTWLYYPPDVIKKDVNNWKKNGLWAHHTEGYPRPTWSKVGEIINPRYQEDGMVGDLFFHMRSQASRDTFEVVKAGIEGVIKPSSFSLEHEGQQKRNREKGRFDAVSLEHHGGAIVEDGASGGTRILSKFNEADNAGDGSIITLTEGEQMEMDEAMKTEIMAMINAAVEEALAGRDNQDGDGDTTGADQVPKAEIITVAKEAAVAVVEEKVKEEIAPLEKKVDEIASKVETSVDAKVNELSKELSKKINQKTREMSGSGDTNIPDDADFSFDDVIVDDGEIRGRR